LRAAISNACEEAGIPYGWFVPNGFILHDLRHTFNTYMRKAWVPETVIMEITGHSTHDMFDRYDTIDGDHKKRAVNRLEAFLKESKQTEEAVAKLGGQR
jgi:integrase